MVIFSMETAQEVSGKELEDINGILVTVEMMQMLIKNGLIWIHKHMRN